MDALTYSPAWWAARLATAPGLQQSLRLLLQATQHAAEWGVDRWQFAVEMAALQRSGIAEADIRWLRLARLIETAVEQTPPTASERTFTPLGNLSLPRGTCLVLSPLGRAVASLGVLSVSEGAPRVPHWDGRARVLHFGGLVVKAFRQPAPNQERILAAFEESAWPKQIDDPIPPRANLNSAIRLHDAIKNLNQHQRHRLLHFRGDGTGTGVLWEPLGCPD